jgi:hypothetical protein
MPLANFISSIADTAPPGHPWRMGRLFSNSPFDWEYRVNVSCLVWSGAESGLVGSCDDTQVAKSSRSRTRSLAEEGGVDMGADR